MRLLDENPKSSQCNPDRDWAASIVGGLAVSFRQTNIIWVAFVAAQAWLPDGYNGILRLYVFGPPGF